MKNHACFTSDPTRATVFLTDLETSNAKQYPHYSGTGDWVIGSRSKCQPEDLGRGKDGFRWLKGLDFYKYPERYPNSAMLFLDNYCSAKPKNFDHRNVVVGESVHTAYPGNAIGTITGPSTEQTWARAQRQPSCDKKAYEYTFRGATRRGAPVRDALLRAAEVGENGTAPWNSKPDVDVHRSAVGHSRATSFWEMMYSSSFALAPRGDCLWSYRFTEALSAGAIPVIYADEWQIPFREAVDPASYLVVVPERDAWRTDEILRAIPAEKRRQLCENGRRIYDRFYSSFDGMLGATLEVLKLWKAGGRGPWRPPPDMSGAEAHHFRLHVERPLQHTK